MSAIEANQRRVIVGAAGLVALLAAGLVLATSWLVSYSVAVLFTAWLIALAGMTFVLVAAFREARATGRSFFGAIGRSFKALGQFILAFF
jgi:hypothetical protein